ncbi:hypothetical protein [Nocardia heshunensis]
MHEARPEVAEISAVWPDPSPLSEWWDEVMNQDGETEGGPIGPE